MDNIDYFFIDSKKERKISENFSNFEICKQHEFIFEPNISLEKNNEINKNSESKENKEENAIDNNNKEINSSKEDNNNNRDGNDENNIEKSLGIFLIEKIPKNKKFLGKKNSINSLRNSLSFTNKDNINNDNNTRDNLEFKEIKDLELEENLDNNNNNINNKNSNIFLIEKIKKTKKNFKENYLNFEDNNNKENYPKDNEIFIDKENIGNKADDMKIWEFNDPTIKAVLSLLKFNGKNSLFEKENLSFSKNDINSLLIKVRIILSFSFY